MSATARLWLHCEAPSSREPAWAAVYRAPTSAPSEHATVCEQLRAREASESVEGFAERVAAALTSLAATHAGGEVAIVASFELLQTSLARSLGLPSVRASAFEPRRGCVSVVDWPTSATADVAPVLLAIDVDWSPPPPSARRAKFPGGPGSAPSARG